MTHEEAFLRAILEAPDDDTPRLVFADYLEETGRDPARAEFVRVQIELAGLPHPGPGHLPTAPALMKTRAGGSLVDDSDPPCACDFCRRKRREQGLLPAMHCRAIVRVGYVWGLDLDFPCPCPWEFRRGFVETVTLPAALFLEHAAALFAAAPVTEVRLTDREPGRIGGRHYWLRATEYAAQPWRIPVDLAYAMNAAERRAGYVTPTAAHVALSAACVTLGRRLAGLPAPAPA